MRLAAQQLRVELPEQRSERQALQDRKSPPLPHPPPPRDRAPSDDGERERDHDHDRERERKGRKRSRPTSLLARSGVGSRNLFTGSYFKKMRMSLSISAPEPNAQGDPRSDDDDVPDFAHNWVRSCRTDDDHPSPLSAPPQSPSAASASVATDPNTSCCTNNWGMTDEEMKEHIASHICNCSVCSPDTDMESKVCVCCSNARAELELADSSKYQSMYCTEHAAEVEQFQKCDTCSFPLDADGVCSHPLVVEA